MDKLKYAFSGDIPVVDKADVAVIGGGPGGFSAAVMAARAGARVVLAEKYGCLGGMSTVGEVHPFMYNHCQGETMDKPVFDEWRRRILTYLPEGQRGDEHLGQIHKYASILAIEDMCLEAGVRLLYHHTLVDCLKDGRKIKAAVLHSKSGFSALAAEVFVDGTGDGDLAVLAGCRYDMGAEHDGSCQPMTTCFKVAGVKRPAGFGRAFWPAVKELKPRMSAAFKKAREEGRIDCPRDTMLFFDWFEEDIIHFNTTRIIHRSGVSGEDLAAAEVEGRRQIRQILDFLRSDIPEFAEARLYSIAHQTGVRETRRIRGLVQGDVSWFEERRKFPDAVCRVNYAIDIHDPHGGGTEWREMPENEWYEIPYGCLVAADADNLLVGCRAISTDHALHSSMRIMPPVCSIGQAAGMAAAMAARQGILPANLDGRAVRAELVKAGASL